MELFEITDMTYLFLNPSIAGRTAKGCASRGGGV
jgi:hypothetical protein